MLKWYFFLAKVILETEVGTQKWAMTSVMGSCNTIVRMYVFNKTSEVWVWRWLGTNSILELVFNNLFCLYKVILVYQNSIQDIRGGHGKFMLK